MNADYKKIVTEYAEAKAEAHSTHPDARLAFHVGLLLGIIDNCLNVMNEEQINYAIGYAIKEQKAKKSLVK
jgi:hypothetical protein